MPRRALVCLLLLPLGCVGPEGPPGEDGQRGAQGLQGIPGEPGPEGSVPQAITSVQPLAVLTGRTADVLISGAGTAWDQTTVVDFGPDIDIVSLTVASTGALAVSLDVDETAAVGPRDITVQTGEDDPLVFAGAFSLEPTLDFFPVLPDVLQGGQVEAVILQRDVDTPFASSPADITVSLEDSSPAIVLSAQPQSLTVRLLADVLHPPGPVTLVVESTLGAEVFRSVLPAALEVIGRTPQGIDPNSVTNEVMPQGPLNALFAIDVAANTALTLAVSSTEDGAVPTMRLLEGGRWDASSAESPLSTTITPAAKTIYAVVYDRFLGGGYNYALTSTTSPVEPETEPNGSALAGQLVVPPATVLAEIGTVGDEDFYVVNLLDGQALTATVTAAGDEVCGPAGIIDTYIELIDSDATTVLNLNEDFSTWCSSLTVSPGAGVYFLRVVASPTYCPDCVFPYGLSLTVE